MHGALSLYSGEGANVSVISSPLNRTLSARWRIPTTDFEATFVAQISASPGLRAV
jgi:hypothetical protein